MTNNNNQSSPLTTTNSDILNAEQRHGSTEVIEPFTHLGRSFQEKVLQALLNDRQWASSFIEVFNVDECLEPPHLKLIAYKYINYYHTYKEFPTMELMVTILRDELNHKNDLVIREQCAAFLQRTIKNENGADLPWVKDKAFTFCRQQLLKKALTESVNVILTDKYETVIDIMKTAISAGMAASPGHDYVNDIDARYSETFRHPIPTGIDHLDNKRVLAGGLGAGEIGIVCAPTGGGKSHILTHFGANALLRRKNVFHYTMELNERYVGIRYDSHLTDINSSDCSESKDVIREYFASNREQLGRLIIKEFPPRSITCTNIKAHIEKMSYRGIKPDMIIVDYAGIIRSTERYDLPRLEMQYVIQELRKLAKELDVPLWTALQSNKEGAKSEIVDSTNLAESYGQASEADCILGLQRVSTQKATGLGTLFVAKNRFGIDGLSFKVHLDTARSKMRVLSDAEVEDLQGSMESEREQIQQDTISRFRQAIKDSKEKLHLTGLGPVRQ